MCKVYRHIPENVAERGAKLFFNTQQNSGANCNACHTGDFFVDESFHVISMAKISSGKGEGEHGTGDLGRLRKTRDVTDKYAFTTHSLFNVTATGPRGYAVGSATLEQANRTHLDPRTELHDYDFSQLASNIQAFDIVNNTLRVIDKFEADRADDITYIKYLSLTNTQVTE